MAWTATADVERFDEAVEWFQGRTILSDEERVGIPAAARSRAFWIAGVAQADVVQDVFDEIGRSIADGVPFEEFQRNVRGKLTEAWGRDNPHRIETIFRNAAQSSYNAGRWHQMQEESVKRFRPFWMHDSVLDSRTTEQCRLLDGVIRPADDPHWDANWPPGHHLCRRGVRSLRRSEAERRGITEEIPDVDVPPGFGVSPRVAQEWRPAPGSRDQGLLDELERKRQARPEPPPPPPRKSLDELEVGRVPRSTAPSQKFREDAIRFSNALTPDEEFQIKQYTGAAYSGIRDSLRLNESDWIAKHGQQHSFPGAYDRMRRVGQQVVGIVERKGGIRSTPRTLYRGITVPRQTAEDMINADQIVADTISSATHDAEVGLSFSGEHLDGTNDTPVLLRLVTRKRGSTAPIQEASGLLREGEVLVGPGKRYRVIGARKAEYLGREVVIVDAEDRNVGELLEFPRRVRLEA